MPELPEVETTKRGITRFVVGPVIQRVIVRQSNLRWPIPEALQHALPGQRFQCVQRRGKYILLVTEVGTVIAHLGMSGNLRIVPARKNPMKHDHVDIVFDDGQCLRFHDPRRFGCMLWTVESPYQHELLKSLGPEPLSNDFSGDYLYRQAKGRKVAIKNVLMNSRIVVGVGNIYANEALYKAGIHPNRAAGRISKTRLNTLVLAITGVLNDAISQGGTTLRDFVNEAGRPGYFQLTLNVYGRNGLPCHVCGTTIKCRRTGQRSTFYCTQCQT